MKLKNVSRQTSELLKQLSIFLPKSLFKDKFPALSEMPGLSDLNNMEISSLEDQFRKLALFNWKDYFTEKSKEGHYDID